MEGLEGRRLAETEAAKEVRSQSAARRVVRVLGMLVVQSRSES